MHGGREAKFLRRVISTHRSALSRQTAEAVRIGRRGGQGAVLNSCSEFNRCYIPRLRLADEDEAKEMEERESEAARKLGEELMEDDTRWERNKARGRQNPKWIIKERSKNSKHSLEVPDSGRRVKKRRFALLTNWGESEAKTTGNDVKTTSETPRSQVDQGGQDGDQWSQEPKENKGGDQEDSCALPGGTQELGDYPDPNQTEGVTLQPMPPEGETLLSWFSPGTIAGHNITASCDDICDAPVVVVEGIVEEKCVFDYFKMRCATHDCVIKRIKVTSQKWGWIKKAMKYGYTSVKVEKTVCTGRGLSDKNFETFPNLPESTAVMPRPDLDTWVVASKDKIKNERESTGILEGDV